MKKATRETREIKATRETSEKRAIKATRETSEKRVTRATKVTPAKRAIKAIKAIKAIRAMPVRTAAARGIIMQKRQQGWLLFKTILQELNLMKK